MFELHHIFKTFITLSSFTYEKDQTNSKTPSRFLKQNQPDAQYLKFILFRNSTLHVSDGLSVHHQESKTVHTASGICHTGSAAAC
jgi:hypothetical protein